ncbi:MAG: hypothetical protein KGN01_08010 [Patescibacteria group bacterium]|nr:hypothetical protein [Patescibacteria group bacterium]
MTLLAYGTIEAMPAGGYLARVETQEREGVGFSSQKDFALVDALKKVSGDYCDLCGGALKEKYDDGADEVYRVCEDCNQPQV